MRTRCPECQTVFRVTPEQLRARAGKVRCGNCQAVFNALDGLVDELPGPAAAPATPVETASPVIEPPTEAPVPAAPIEAEIAAAGPVIPSETEEPPADVADAQELGKAAGLILPRETTEIPGYSKWAEGVMAPAAAPEDKPARWPFVLAAALLVLGLCGQAAYHFRAELAVSLPALRPLLVSLSEALGSTLPLPAHAELVSIETSDLQTDAARGNLLVLNATLRNRAPYAQAYPSLELSLTDTQDTAIARRVFPPSDYLPAKLRADPTFPAGSDLAVRLWIEARDVSAAGYRLFVFYP